MKMGSVPLCKSVSQWKAVRSSQAFSIARIVAMLVL